MQTNKIGPINFSTQAGLKNSLLDTTSRYRESEFIYYSRNNILTMSMYDRVIDPTSEAGKKIIDRQDIKYYVITRGTQYKPYLAAKEIYGDVGYWWFLMESNNIFDIEEFVAGKTLKILPINITKGF